MHFAALICVQPTLDIHSTFVYGRGDGLFIHSCMKQAASPVSSPVLTQHLCRLVFAYGGMDDGLCIYIPCVQKSACPVSLTSKGYVIGMAARSMLISCL